MKKILITGQNSYIGNKFEEWVSQWPDEYQITKISVRNDDWKNQNWSTYDVVLNVAGIAHQKITKNNENDYYKVNRDLAIEIAKKAKQDNVKHFIQISTMSVFGIDNGEIIENTPTIPKNAYGKAKLEADEYIKNISTSSFIVSIVRPPMIYGNKSPGNYKKLSNLSKYINFFPNVHNFRSMIFIDNLNNYLKITIDNSIKGFHYPQNKEFINTYELIFRIRQLQGKKIKELNLFNNFLKNSRIGIFNKIFGTLIYSPELSKFELNYEVATFEESIIKSERGSVNL